MFSLLTRKPCVGLLADPEKMVLLRSMGIQDALENFAHWRGFHTFTGMVGLESSWSDLDALVVVGNGSLYCRTINQRHFANRYLPVLVYVYSDTRPNLDPDLLRTKTVCIMPQRTLMPAKLVATITRLLTAKAQVAQS